MVKINETANGPWHRVFSKPFRTEEEATLFMSTHKLYNAAILHSRWELIAASADFPEDLYQTQKVLQDNNYDACIVRNNNSTHKLVVGAFVTLREAKRLETEVNKLGIKARVGLR